MYVTTVHHLTCSLVRYVLYLFPCRLQIRWLRPTTRRGTRRRRGPRRRRGRGEKSLIHPMAPRKRQVLHLLIILVMNCVRTWAGAFILYSPTNFDLLVLTLRQELHQELVGFSRSLPSFWKWLKMRVTDVLVPAGLLLQTGSYRR